MQGCIIPGTAIYIYGNSSIKNVYLQNFTVKNIYAVHNSRNIFTTHGDVHNSRNIFTTRTIPEIYLQRAQFQKYIYNMHNSRNIFTTHGDVHNLRNIFTTHGDLHAHNLRNIFTTRTIPKNIFTSHGDVHNSRNIFTTRTIPKIYLHLMVMCTIPEIYLQLMIVSTHTIPQLARPQKHPGKCLSIESRE